MQELPEGKADNSVDDEESWMLQVFGLLEHPLDEWIALLLCEEQE